LIYAGPRCARDRVVARLHRRALGEGDPVIDVGMSTERGQPDLEHAIRL
jgi:hypothetical protein